jgi:hypothetical protein
MKPKERAAYLILKYMSIVVEQDLAKECALAAIEFARHEFKDYCAAGYGIDGSPDDHFNNIKQEIKNL